MHSPVKSRLFYLRQRRPEPLLRRLPLDVEPASYPGLCADVRKPQEIESLRLALPLLAPNLGGEPAELDERGFVKVQRKTELLQTPFQCGEKFIGLVSMLESRDNRQRNARRSRRHWHAFAASDVPTDPRRNAGRYSLEVVI
jgi:hypothetical protein